MTTLFETSISASTVDDSSYVTSLETVAPGIVGLIESASVLREDWWNTLRRIMPNVSCNAEQETLLLAMADRAESGLYPVGYVAPAPVVNVGAKPSVEKMMTWVSVGALVIQLL